MYVATAYAWNPRALVWTPQGWRQRSDRTHHSDDIFIIAGPFKSPLRWMAEALAKNSIRNLLADRCFYEVTVEEPVTAQPEG